MTNSFTNSSSYLLAAESVTEGHPDKLCDQVSDAILDTILDQDPMGRVACETATTTGLILVMGEITTTADIEFARVIRETVRTVGYTDSSYGFDYETCGVMVSLKEQSADIDIGVSSAMETRQELSEESFDRIGAGDQGTVVGFACAETPELMPLPIMLSHKLCYRLASIRKEGTLPYLRPDGKAQVVVEYSGGVPQRIDSITVSTQHGPEVSHDVLENDVRELVIGQGGVPRGLIDGRTKIYVNPTGRFVIGGPMGDAGVTGRKIQVDTYGAGFRHGGGAFSGKDPTKVDRSGAYAARHVAKNVVAAGLADRVELQVSYVIGMAHPVSIALETFGTGYVEDDLIKTLIDRHFDLRPSAIIHNMNLRRPIYRPTAAYGHFGREDLDLPWEYTEIANLLRSDAGERGLPNRSLGVGGF